MQNTTAKTFITENVVGTHIGRLKEIAAKSDKLNYDNELHGKVYLFYEGDIPTGFIIGASNFTDKGLEKNNPVPKPKVFKTTGIIKTEESVHTRV